MKDKITIKGARVHNLKNVSLTLPRDALIVFTGVSGSGKTSLAFDTIFADGQRRYVESLSSYARQFMGQMEKPDVDSIDGLSPAIAIDQKTTSKNPRSTVGTVTEIHDYLRLLFARVGTAHCPICRREIRRQTVDEIVDKIMSLGEGEKLQILSPVVRQSKGTHQKELENARRSGFVRVRVDGNMYELTENIELEKNKKHSIELVVDRVVVKADATSRIADSIETALSLSSGLAVVLRQNDEELLFSQNYSCPDHGAVIEALSPALFSFNNPLGACDTCSGLGALQMVDPQLIIQDHNLSIEEGAIRASGWNYLDGGIAKMYLDALSNHYSIPLDTPVKNLTPEQIDIIMYGTKGEKIPMVRDIGGKISKISAEFEGIANNLTRRYKETTSEYARYDISNYMTSHTCPSCHGNRLKKNVLSVLVGEKNIADISNMSVGKALDFFTQLNLENSNAIISQPILAELKARLSFLKNVGLEYLTLSRRASTLSGGESQRIRLATQIGSSLMGVLYILDEPSIGLHQRDNDKLIATLKSLRDIGNTVIVVEHDDDTMLASDYIVDVGPGAGVHGGEIIFAGKPQDILTCKDSITGKFLSGKDGLSVPKERRTGNVNSITIHGAKLNNLKNIDVSFPLGKLVVVSGVSGSGKSTLVNEVLLAELQAKLNGAKPTPDTCRAIDGTEHINKIISIDQTPIGRTPRSNPATYTGAFADIRQVFAGTNDAKLRGYGVGRFSFNVKGGRCEHCQGDGLIKIEMHFLPDIFVPCEVCKGRRYNRETLEIKYKGKTIHDVLEMTVEEALDFFQNHTKIRIKLQTLVDVGLGYVRLGQSATTLSGGEAQRVKLATELLKRATGTTLYILDEPTTGLHAADVKKLVEVLQRLVDAGNTAIIIEHNLDLIKCADHIIDLGPEGGDGGGEVIVTGTPEEVSKCKKSHTGKYLNRKL